MAKKRRIKRKCKITRIAIVSLGIGVCLLATRYIISTYFNHGDVLLSDSIHYEIPKEGIPIALLNGLERNPELRKFVSEYPKKKDEKTRVEIQNDMKTGEVPIFMQWDERWGYSPYGDDMMGLTGCGPTALSMVLVYLQNDDRWNPYEVAQYVLNNGYYHEGEGTSWLLMSEGAQAMGVKVETIGLDEQMIRQILRAGNLIICSVGPGDFTQTGHFIVLTGIASDGDFTIHDPNRMSNTNKTWDFTTLKKQIVSLWAYYV